MHAGVVEQRNRDYATPLKAAKKAGRMDMVDILLAHGARDYDVTQVRYRCMRILHACDLLACRYLCCMGVHLHG